MKKEYLVVHRRVSCLYRGALSAGIQDTAEHKNALDFVVLGKVITLFTAQVPTA